MNYNSPWPSTCFLTGLAYLLSGPGLGVLARYSWGKMLTFGGHHGVTLMQIRHMAVAGFSSFNNFQVSMAESIIVCRSSLTADFTGSWDWDLPWETWYYATLLWNTMLDVVAVMWRTTIGNCLIYWYFYSFR